MTFIVPNYFLEKDSSRVITKDALFSMVYSTRKNNDRIAVRNTTHVMIFIIHGAKHLRSLDGEYHLQSGDVLLLTQGNYFMSEIVSLEGEYEAIMIYFDDDFIAEFVAKYQVSLEDLKSENIVVFSTSGLLKHLVDSFKLYMHQPSEKKSDIIKLKTQEIFLHLLEADKKRFSQFLYAITSTSRERIKHILEANIDMIESVEDMCRIARVSPSELRSATQSAFKLSPKAWLDDVRLAQATVMLKSTDKTISEIATTCGYASLSWFGVQFKKKYGCTPKMYREEKI